jgi:hypothetical protein
VVPPSRGAPPTEGVWVDDAVRLAGAVVRLLVGGG